MKEWLYRQVRIQLVDGDIAEQDTEAVTTAAHWRLNAGTGTDGTIHTKGGPTILEACRQIGGCPIGDAVVTSAGKLRARYIIHAVGPVWNTEQDEEQTKRLLCMAYENTLKRVAELKVKSVSIPAISTGAFAMSVAWAVPIAVNTVFDFLDQHEGPLELVRHVVYTKEIAKIDAAFRKEIDSQIRQRTS